MGKGRKAPSDQTVVQTNIPEYAEPYFMAMMDDATGVSSQAYTPYPGQRVANQSGDTLSSYDMVRNIAGSGIPYLDQAVGGTQGVINQAQGIAGAAQQGANYNPYQFSQYGGFQDASGLASPYAGFDAYNFGNPQMWNNSTASQYMSPYIENVMNVQKDRAQLDFNRMQQYRDAEATKAGAFGGSRQGVVDALAQEDLMRNFQEIDSQGLQNAYTTGNQMFQADRTSGLNFGVQQSGEYARVQEQRAQELARTQGISVEEARRVQAAQAGELGRVQGAQAGENLNAARFGQDSYRTALDALGLSGQLNTNLAGFGEAERAAGIQGAQLLEASGKAQEAYQQAGLNVGYEDFLRQQGWEQDQLSWLSNILRGVPVEPNVTSTQFTTTNPLQDAMGMGISAIGLYNGLK
jgi:hypothetical protein